MYRISERGQRAGIEVLELAGLEANVRRSEHNLGMGSASGISVRGMRLDVQCWRCGSGGVESSLFPSFCVLLFFSMLRSHGLQRFRYCWQMFWSGKWARFSFLDFGGQGEDPGSTVVLSLAG